MTNDDPGEPERLSAPRLGEIFAQRALRARQLSVDHPMSEFLVLHCLTSQAQHELAQNYPDTELAVQTLLHTGGKAPFDKHLWPRQSIWRDLWRQLLAKVSQSLSEHDPGSPALKTLHALGSWDDELLESQAQVLLGASGKGLDGQCLDVAAAPFVFAGLSLYWTVMAARSKALLATVPSFEGACCPCCASAPVASVLDASEGAGSLRYLHCSLCNCRWRMVRIKCANCLSTSHLAYQSLQSLQSTHKGKGDKSAERAGIQAETCSNCHHYLKIFDVTRFPVFDVVADDLASLALDLLVREEGFEPQGVNPFLHFDAH